MNGKQGTVRRFETTDSLLASVWLVVLIAPVIILVTREDALWRTVTGILLVLVFGAVYAVAFGVHRHTPARLGPRGRILFWFTLLAVVTVVTGAAVGVTAAYFVPFLVAYLAFILPPSRSIGPVVVIVTGSSWAGYLAGGVAWPSVLWATVASPVLVYLIALASHRAETEQELAHDLEKTRQREALAVDVHDLLGHSLTVVTLKAELAARLVDSDPDAAKEELMQIARISRTSLAEVRATVTRMRQPDLAGELAGAARALQTAGIEASLPDDASVAGPNAHLFSWVVREAVTNVVRHSGARHCAVEVTGDRVLVSDDGGGFDGPDGGGLAGLRGRVADAGGTLTVTSTPAGTDLLVTMTGALR